MPAPVRRTPRRLTLLASAALLAASVTSLAAQSSVQPSTDTRPAASAPQASGAAANRTNQPASNGTATVDRPPLPSMMPPVMGPDPSILALIPASARADAGKGFDAEAATRAYLATIPASKKAQSDAYFEGGYWITLWDFVLSAAVLVLLLNHGWSRAMRDRAERVARRPSLRTFVYFAQYVTAYSLILFPFTAYTDWWRERRYGLATQTFGPWLGDEVKTFGLTLVFGGLAVMGLYGVVRRLPRSWPVWGALVTMAFVVVSMLFGPVYILPLFNKVTRLQDARVRDPIISMARASGIPARDVFVVDASRQTTRVSANVSGIFGTMRITLNDNLLHRGTLPEIEAVMGHEMGHYVLNHVYEMLVELLVIVVAGFALLKAAFERARRCWGERWGIRGLDDPAGLPLAALIVSAYLFALTPVLNTIVRTNEQEADTFGLNASRQPDGFALVTLKLADYRKLEPSPLEEWMFYDHPSGRTRILGAMRWKAEHPNGPFGP